MGVCAHQDLIHKSFFFKCKHIIDSAGQAPDDPQLLLTGANSDLWPLVLHQSARTDRPQIEASISASIRRPFYEICFTCEGTWSSLLLFYNHFVPVAALFWNQMNTVAYFQLLQAAFRLPSLGGWSSSLPDDDLQPRTSNLRAPACMLCLFKPFLLSQ